MAQEARAAGFPMPQDVWDWFLANVPEERRPVALIAAAAVLTLLAWLAVVEGAGRGPQ